MVLPLLGLAGLAGLMSGGGTALGNWLQQRQQAEQQQRMQAALNAGMVAPQTAQAPPEDPDFYGHGAAMQTPGYFNPQLMAMELARQGDPMGLQMLAQQAGSDQGFQQDIYMQHMRDQAAMDRVIAGQAPPASQPSNRSRTPCSRSGR